MIETVGATLVNLILRRLARSTMDRLTAVLTEKQAKAVKRAFHVERRNKMRRNAARKRDRARLRRRRRRKKQAAPKRPRKS